MRLKNLFFTFVSLLFVLNLSAQHFSESQFIKSNDKIYDSLKEQFAESEVLGFTQATPLSVSEMKFYFNQIEKDKLSSYGASLYDDIYTQLYTQNDFMKMLKVDTAFRFYLNPKINLELFTKSNELIPYSFNYFMEDFPLTLPILIGFDDFVTIETDLFIGKNSESIKRNPSFTNVLYEFNDFEFFFPKYAYGGFAKQFDNWGISFQIGREGYQIGDTVLGSIIYNDTFESDCYTVLNFYSNIFRYSLDVIEASSNNMDSPNLVSGEGESKKRIYTQSSNSRFMYLHHFDFRLFKRFTFSTIEGVFAAAPLDLRYLNPLCIMHQFGSFYEHNIPDDYIYQRANESAYMCFMFEYVPVKDLRFYGLFAQNEHQTGSELTTDYGKSYPESIAIQLGGDYNLHLSAASKLKFNLECLYNSPYMYIRHNPAASFYRFRVSQVNGQDKSYSWVGSPYGPDCAGGQLSVSYVRNKKFSVNLEYLFLMHGEKDFDIFDEVTKGYYSYYPAVLFNLIKKDGGNVDDVIKDARSMVLSGTVEYNHSVALRGEYYILKNLKLGADLIYTLSLNCNHKENNTQHNVEAGLVFSYTIF